MLGALPIKARLYGARARYAARVARYLPRTLLSAFSGRHTIVIDDHRDFGNVVDKGPQRIETVASAEQIAGVLARVGREGTHVNTCGAAHSINGHSLSRGVRLRLARPGRAPRMLDAERVEVPAETFWGELEEYLNAKGRSVPVLTDNLLTTVAGTLSVGGIGSRSLCEGRQIDAVERLHLVLPNGEIMWCSEDEEPDLFRHALGGLGLVGVIDRVVLRTVEYRPFLAVFELQHPSAGHAVRELALELAKLAELPADLRHFNIEGPILGTPFVVSRLGFECRDRAQAERILAEPPPFAARLSPYLLRRKIEDTAEFIRWTTKRGHVYYAAMGPTKHLWADWFFLDPEAFSGFVAWLEREVLVPGRMDHLVAGFALLLRTFETSARFPLSYVPDGQPYAYYFYVAYAVPQRDAAGLERIDAMLERARREAHARGGRLYLNSQQRFDRETLERVYGDDYRGLVALKKRVDPGFVLNPDVLGIGSQRGMA